MAEDAYDAVDSLVIQFNKQRCVIDLINYRISSTIEEEEEQEENEFIHVLYNIMYTHYQLQQPVEFYLIIVCRSRVGVRRAFAGTLDRPNYPGIQSDEDTGSYALRTHVLPAMRKLFTDDHDDHEDWTYGRRTFRMKDDGDKVSCVINWNHPLPNAGAAAFALGKGRGVPDDLIQYALEYGGPINAKRFKRDPEQWVYDPRRQIIVDSDLQRPLQSER